MQPATLCYVTVDPGAPEAPYLQLAEILRDRIRRGDYPPRSKLPTLAQLSHQHTLAITTVQKALALLKDEGLVVGSPGRGVYVR